MEPKRWFIPSAVSFLLILALIGGSIQFQQPDDMAIYRPIRSQDAKSQPAAITPEMPPIAEASLPSTTETAAHEMQSRFMPYQGDTSAVQYTAALHNGVAFVTDNHLTYDFRDEQHHWVLRERLVGAAPFHIVPDATTSSPVSMFIGNNPDAWQQDLTSYQALSLGHVYPGIALQLRAIPGAIEKLFMVEPGVSPDTIALQLEGATAASITPDGALNVTTGLGTITLSPPIAYQEQDNEYTPVTVAYALHDAETDTDTIRYGFSLGAYDVDAPLVIDPTLAATYVGGDSGDELNAVTTDSEGNIYVTGESELLSSTSAPYPTTTGAYSTTMTSDHYSDVVVSKFDPTLSTLLASTYIGGSQADSKIYGARPHDVGMDIAIDSNGNVVVVGECISTDYPTTPGAYDTTNAPWRSFTFGLQFSPEGFISILDADLTTLVASTFLGGEDIDSIYSIALGADGDIYVAGVSSNDGSDFEQPTPDGYQMNQQGSGDGLVARFSPDLTTLRGMTLFGGDGTDYLHDLAISSTGEVFIAGITRSETFPLVTGGYNTTPNTEKNSFTYIAKLSPDLTDLQASTFVGNVGLNTWSADIVLDTHDRVYIASASNSDLYPVTDGAYQTTHANKNFYDAVVSHLSNDLSTLLASTYIGGSGEDQAQSIVYDEETNTLYLALSPGSSGWAGTLGAFYETHRGEEDTIIIRMNAILSRMLASTYYGGAGNDGVNDLTIAPSGNLVFVGGTFSNDFPHTEGNYDSTYGGGFDGVIVSMSPALGYGGIMVSMPEIRNVAPGQEASFLVRYRNTSEDPIDDVVVVIDVPPGIDYVTSSHNGFYYPGGSAGGQVAWRLGTVSPHTGDDLTVTLDVPWGTPEGATPIFARTSATGIESPLFDVQPYLDYEPLQEESTLLSESAVASLIATKPISEVLVVAERAGYNFFGTATETSRSDGAHLTQLHLFHEDGLFATLTTNYIANAAPPAKPMVFVEAFDAVEQRYIIFDATGGYDWNRAEGTRVPWGAWALADTNTFLMSAIPDNDALLAGLQEARCQLNCTINSIPDAAAGHLIDVYGTYSYIKDCKICADSYERGTPDYNACAKCTTTTAENHSVRIAKRVPGVGTAVGWVVSVKNCYDDCTEDPSSHICTEAKVECCTGLIASGTKFLFDTSTICTTKCNRTVGIYAPISERTNCALGVPCNNGACGECKGPSCKTTKLSVRAPRDPNMKSSDTPGNVLPGQEISYTIDYENVGSGTAEDVYILDVLDAALDDTTIVFDDGADIAEYSAASRTVSWDIGTLDAGEKGQVTFRISVRDDVADGTNITNVATVYFPSSFEETPTNPVIHQVSSVVAEPQTVTTASAPIDITLTGTSGGGGTLDYAIVQEPLYGTLSGTPPAVTYTPGDGFVGQDSFTFSAATGGSSNTADIIVTVNPSPNDSDPPEVVATSPASNATGASGSMIRIEWSESLDATSVITGTVQVVDSTTAEVVAGQVTYDALAHTMVFYPDEPLAPTTRYEVTVVGIRDAQGNDMAGVMQWEFTTASAESLVVTLPDQATTLRFGGTLSDTSQIVSVSSVGSKPVAIDTIAISGTTEFAITADTCSNQSLAVNETCSVFVTFEPAAGDTTLREGWLVIPSNDSDAPQVQVPLVGYTTASDDTTYPVYLPLVRR